jgi:hypothetical protein
VLTKQVDKLEGVNEQNFSSILPNANINDFYVQHFISGEQSFVSIIRKADADKGIAEAENANIIPLSLSLGPFVLDTISPQLNTYSGDIIFNGHTVKRDETGNWLDVSADNLARSEFPFKADAEPLAEEQLLPYAASFQLIIGVGGVIANIESLAYRHEDTLKRRKLKVTGAITLAIFFILLLVNIRMVFLP